MVDAAGDAGPSPLTAAAPLSGTGIAAWAAHLSLLLSAALGSLPPGEETHCSGGLHERRPAPPGVPAVPE